MGPTPNAAGGSVGFLPNVAVTALALFNSGGEKLLRASTYGRGVWAATFTASVESPAGRRARRVGRRIVAQSSWAAADARPPST